MDLMLSWSKPQSKAVASALHNWLPTVLPGIKPWISAKDIDKGREWFQELQGTLSTTRVCIICITEENVRSPWIYYEVGAIATNGPDVLICPYLINVQPSFLSGGPFTQWQCTLANREDTWDLVKSLNTNALEGKHDSQLLHGNFEARWAQLEEKLDSLPIAADTEGLIESPIEALTHNPLTQEAIELLLTATEDSDGYIMYLNMMGGTEIATNGINMIKEQSAREVAKWKGALDLLVTEVLVEPRGKKGELFSVTSNGFNVADVLREARAT